MIKNKNNIVMTVSLILIFLFMFLASSFNTGKGAATVRNIYYPDSEGNILRAQLFIPNEASSSNPAPAVLNMHGGGDHLECVGNFSLELARRGYVVLNMDAYGSGFSDYTSGKVTSNAGSGNKNSSELKNDGGASVSLEQLLSYSFVDQDNIGLIGHSMGGTYIANAALEHAEHIKAIMPWGSGSFLDLIKTVDSDAWTFNIGYVSAKNDEMVLFATHLHDTSDLMKQSFIKDFMRTDKDIEPGEIYGSFDKGNARVIYTPTTSHLGNLISSQTIGDLVTFFESAMPTGTGLAPENQVWKYKETFSILAILSLLCFIISLGFSLSGSRPFNSLNLEPQTNSVKFNRPVRLTGTLALIAIPMLTLYNIGLPLSMKKASLLFPMNWGNYFAWLAAINAAIILVLFLILHFTYGRKHGGSLQSYGLSIKSGDSASGALQILKALGFAAIIVFAVYVIVNMCYAMFNIDFRFLIFAVKPIDPVRIKFITGYFLMFLIAFGILNVVSVSFANLSAETDSKWGIFKQYLIGWLIGAGGFTIILLIYYIGLTVNHYPPFFIGFGPFPDGHPISLVFSMKMITVVPMFTFASVINTALYRKTKNIYVGWFTAALLLAVISVTVNAFSY